MEPVLKVALPVATDAPKLMGSPESSGLGSSRSSVVLVRERWHKDVTRDRKDYVYDNNTSVSTFWPKTPDSIRPVEIASACSLPGETVSAQFNLSSKNSLLCKDLVEKPILEKSTKKVRNNGGVSKRSGMVEVESSKCRLGSSNPNGTSFDFASSSASYNIPDFKS